MIQYPKNIERKLDFSKFVYIKINVALDFTNAKPGVGAINLFEDGHEQLEEMFPEFMSHLKYTKISTSFENNDSFTPVSVKYSVELTVKGQRQYAMCKQTMNLITDRTTRQLGIEAEIDVAQVYNVTLASVVREKIRTFFNFH